MPIPIPLAGTSSQMPQQQSASATFSVPSLMRATMGSTSSAAAASSATTSPTSATLGLSSLTGLLQEARERTEEMTMAPAPPHRPHTEEMTMVPPPPGEANRGKERTTEVAAMEETDEENLEVVPPSQATR